MRHTTIFMPMPILCGIVLSLIFLSAQMVAAQVPIARTGATPEPCSVTVEGPTPPEVNAQDTIEFRAVLHNQGSSNPTYTWTMDPPSLGFHTQGDSTITTSQVDGSIAGVRARVKLGGSGDCEGKQGTSALVRVNSDVARVDNIGECSGKTTIDECQQLKDKLLQELKKDSKATARIVFHPKGTVTAVSLRATEFMAASFTGGKAATATPRRESVLLQFPTAQQDAGGQLEKSAQESQSVAAARSLAESVRVFLIRSEIDPSRIAIEQGESRPEMSIELFIVRPGTKVIAGVGAGAVPNVDLRWDVLGQEVVGDNFGRRVRKNYYAVRVTISNDTGKDFHLESVGFTLPPSASSPSRPLLTLGYGEIRGTIIMDQRLGPRGLGLATIKTAGSLLTGAVAFVRNDHDRAIFSQFINIVSNPLQAGYETLFPDQTFEHLGRLDEYAFHDDAGSGLLIENNSFRQAIVFVPKKSLNLAKPERDNPSAVFRAFGKLTVTGRTILRLNSITITR